MSWLSPPHMKRLAISPMLSAASVRAQGLGESTYQEHHVPLNWTSAEKSDVRNYRPGQILEFHRAVTGVAGHEWLEVIGVERGNIVARNTHGEEREFATKQGKCFEVYERRAIEVAPNDKLLLMSNRRERGVRATNGELVSVSRIDELGRIHLQDGRTLPENYKQFTHGYAVTAHRSQGKSVDAVVISGDGMRKELFYVAASRARESVTVVTSDKELLRETVARSVARQSASELERKVQSPSLREKGLKPTLRERELRARSAPPEQLRDTGWEEGSQSKNAPASKTALAIDQEKPTREEKQEQAIEPSHYYGIGR